MEIHYPSYDKFDPNVDYPAPRAHDYGWGKLSKYSALFAAEHFMGQRLSNKLLAGSRDKLKGQMLTSLQQGEKGKLIPLPSYRDLPQEDFFKHFVKTNRPVVFKGLASDWECCKKWNFDFFKENYGDDEVMLLHHRAYDSSVTEESIERTTLKAFIDKINGGATEYARFFPLLQKHPELRDDINQKWLEGHMSNKNRAWLRFYKLFIGAKGTETSIHNAGNENFFVQIEGLKKWRLYEMDTSPIMDPRSNRSNYKHTSYNPGISTEQEFPMAQYMDYYEVVLEPGDVLYVPPYIWHHVSNPTQSIGVACRWNNIFNAFRSSPLLSTLEVFNTNPNMVKGMMMAMDDYNKVLASSVGLSETSSKKS